MVTAGPVRKLADILRRMNAEPGELHQMWVPLDAVGSSAEELSEMQEQDRLADAGHRTEDKGDALMVPNNRPNDYVVSGPCQCPKCRLARVIHANLETKWTEIEHPNPGMFRSWGQIALALIGGAMFLGALFMLWAIFSR